MNYEKEIVTNYNHIFGDSNIGSYGGSSYPSIGALVLRLTPHKAEKKLKLNPIRGGRGIIEQIRAVPTIITDTPLNERQVFEGEVDPVDVDVDGLDIPEYLDDTTKELENETNREFLFKFIKYISFGNQANIGRIVGFIVNGDKYDDPIKLSERLAMKENMRTISVVIQLVSHVDKDKVYYKYESTSFSTAKSFRKFYDTMIPSKNKLELLSLFYDVEIKSSEISGEIFGLKTQKKKLVGSIITDWEIAKSNHGKLGGNSFVIDVKTMHSSPDKNKFSKNKSRFVFSELEFIDLKRFNIKSYNQPKDKLISLGSIIVLKYNHDSYKVPLNAKYKVTGIKKNHSSKHMNTGLNQHDKVNCIELATGITYSFYAKDLKKYE